MIVLALLQLWLFCRQNLRSRALRPAICRQTGVMTLTQMERGPTEKGQISCPLFLIGPHWALLPPSNLLGHLPQPLAISYLPGFKSTTANRAGMDFITGQVLVHSTGTGNGPFSGVANLNLG